MAFVPTADDLLRLTDAHIVEWAWSSGDRQVINVVKVDYDWDLAAARGIHGTRQTYSKQSSIDMFGRRSPLVIASRGIRTANGGQTIADNRALEVIRRYAAPPPLLTAVVFYLHHPLEPGDQVRITHPRIPNHATGVRGLTHELFEVVDVTPSFAGLLRLTLLWIAGLEAQTAPTSGGAVAVPIPEKILAGDVGTDEITRTASYANSAAIAIGTAEVETGTVTVTLNKATDDVVLLGTQYLWFDSQCGASAIPTIKTRMRVDSLTGTLLEGKQAEIFVTAPSDKGCGASYYASRGPQVHNIIHAPGITGTKTYKLSAIASAAGIGAFARDRSLRAVVRSR